MMSRNPGWLGLLVALVLVLALPGSARAQDAPSPKLSESQKRQTKEHYEQATKYYNLGKYSEAVAEYQAAYLISADPVMLYNIAQCHRLNNQPDDAARFYKNYLRNAPSAVNRAEVEKKIEEMERLSEERRRQGASAPANPPATPSSPPSGTPTPGTGETQPPLGQIAHAPSLTPPEVTVPPPGATPEASVQQSLPPEPPPPRSKVVPMSLVIGGGALVATGLVFGAVAGSKAKQVEEKSRASNARFDDSIKKLEKAGKSASALAVVSGLAGLVAGGLGAYLWLRSPSESAPPSTTVFPITGSGYAGAGVSLLF
jgi:tetratricopeptide (TPR) repeat protein